jgi:hypothetical protein
MADMTDRRVVGQGAGNRLRPHRLLLVDRQRHRHAPGLPRQPGHAVGIGADHRDQDAPAHRHEGADRRLVGEMAAALQGQGGMRLGRAAGDGAQIVAHPGIDRAEIVVPGRQVLRHGGAHLGTGGDRAWD